MDFNGEWKLDSAPFDRARFVHLGDGRFQLRRNSGSGTPQWRGTNLPCELMVAISNQGGTWVADVNFNGSSSRALLSDCVAGTARFTRVQNINLRIGRAARFDLDRPSIVLRADFALEINCRSPSRGETDRFNVAVTGFLFERAGVFGSPQLFRLLGAKFSAGGDPLDQAGRHSGSAARRMARAEEGRSIVIVGVRSQILMAEPGPKAEITIAYDETGERPRTELRLHDRDAKLVVAGDDFGGKPAVLAMSQLSLVSVRSEGGERADWELALAPSRQAAGTDRFSVGLTGLGAEPLKFGLAGFVLRDGLTMPVGLVDASVPTTERVAVDVLFAVGSGNKESELALLPRPPSARGIPASLRFGSDGPRPAPAADAAFIRLGTNHYLVADLKQARLRLRRTLDGLDLAFGLPGYAIKVASGTASLEPIASADAYRQTVHFWPQHIQEEAFSPAPGTVQSAIANVLRPLRNLLGAAEAPKHRAAGEFAAVEYAKDKRSRLARTRTSGPSRIAFDRTSAAQAIPLTVAALTDWQRLPLIVDKRAFREAGADDADLSIDRQITDIAGIEPGDSQETARAKVKASFGWRPEAPRARLSPDVTSLELVTGLQFSPSSGARFVPTDPAPRGTQAQQWSASLIVPEGEAVRALSAPDLDLRVFDPRLATDLDAESGTIQSVLERRDRREIVLLSSGVGMAALRALNQQGTDQSASLVRLPAAKFNYLAGPSKPGDPQPEGVVAPKPFSHFAATLSAIGADIDIEWEGEPPQSYVRAGYTPFLARGFGLEHYVHRTRHGRDAFVRVVNKGYLMPFGFRASHIKTAMRETVYDRELGYVFPLIVHEYIAVSRPVRRFDGPYHPNEARDLHAVELTMITRLTPSLDARRAADMIAKTDAFWPKVDGEDFQFEYRADDLPGTRKMPMAFVPNGVIGNPAQMRAVTEAYMARAGEPWSSPRRIEILSSAEAVFAPSRKMGDTNFEAEAALIGVRPRTPPADAKDVVPFMMDAFMEGADQPPFYPYLERARIKVRSLERLTGLPSPLVEVSYYEGYRDAGFDPGVNPGELFLRVLTPGVGMGLGNNGSAAGGVARPEAPLAALSRTQGLIGGRPARPRGSARVALDNEGAPAEAAYDVSAAAAGRFDPAQFFKGATLLGIVPLELVVKAAGIAAAPLMKEAIDVAAIDPATAAAIADGLDKAAGEIDTATGNATRAIVQALGAGSFESYYPELARSLGQLAGSLRTLAAELRVPQSNATAAILRSGPQVLQAWPPLKRALEALGRDPLPPVVSSQIAAYLRRVEEVLAYVKDDDLARALAEQITRTAVDTVLSDALIDLLIESRLVEFVFGPLLSELDPQPWDLVVPSPTPRFTDPPAPTRAAVRRLIRDVSRDPDAASSRLALGIANETLGRPLVDLLAMLGSFAASGSSKWRWPKRALFGAVARVLVQPAAGAAPVRARALAEAAEAIVDAVSRTLDEHAASAPGNVGALSAWLAALPLRSPELDRALAKLVADLPGEIAQIRERARQWGDEAEKLKVKLREPIAAEERKRLEALRQRMLALQIEGDERARQLATIAETVIRDNSAIASRIVQTAVATLQSAQAAIQDAERKVDEKIERLQLLLARAVDFTEKWRGAALLARDHWCRQGTATVNGVVTAMLGRLVPAASELHKASSALTTALDSAGTLDLPAIADIAGLEAYREAAAALRGQLAKCRDAFARFADTRAMLAPGAPASCERIDQLFQPLSQAILLWRETAHATGTLADQLIATGEALAAAKLVNPLASAADPILQQVLANLAAAFRTIAAYDTYKDNAWRTPLQNAVANIPGGRAEIQARLAQLDAAVATLVNDTKPDAERLRAWADTAKLVVDGALSRLVDNVAKYALLGNGKFLPVIDTLRKAIVEAVLTAVDTPTSAGLDAVKQLKAALTPGAEAGEIGVMLGQPLIARLNTAQAPLESDARAIAAARQPGADVAGAIVALVNSWGSRGPGLLVAARIFLEGAQALARGQIGSLIDFSIARQALESALRDIVPAKATVEYSWGTELAPFPSSDPIFAMDDGVTFERVEDDKDMPAGDLSLSAVTEIDLLRPGKPKLTARGRIKPFRIHLLGQRFDLVTIHFKGARFSFKDGKSEFGADISGVTIGPMLTFLQALAPFMAGGRDDNGPFVVPSFAPPGIEAGYRFATDLIQVGSLQFQNVAMAVSAFLPFQARQAEFRFVFASRERPFLVSQPPYGGGGYLALYATARGIASFALQLEFGAVTALRMGPFRGTGRVTAGIYIRSGGGSSVLEGFVHAVGEGSVACFSLTINIEVRVRHANGSMVGETTYRVTFKVGLVKLKYSITARYKIKGGGSRAADLLLAGRDAGEVSHAGRRLTVERPHREDAWNEYTQLYAEAW